MFFLLDAFFHLLYSTFAPLRRHFILIDIHSQRLVLYKYGTAIAIYNISTAKKGTGEAVGSYQTPRGWLRALACHGDGQPLDMLFRARRPVGRISDQDTKQSKDPILARIVQLSGLQWHNRHTHNRYIYIHGALSSRIDQRCPLSQGCINMSVQDIAALYEKIDRGTWVYVIDVKNGLYGQPCFFSI
jgi:threonine dehydrogenase-like Zn-dependent dehydrogenase